MNATKSGEEFREDLRPGRGNAAARRILTPAELAALTELSDTRSLAAMLQTFGVLAAAIAFGVAVWPSPWLLLSVLVVGVQQHALFILAHEAAHYRLLRSRTLNDLVGRAIGIVGGVSMCTYRVIHRLHHNNLYTAEDPDTAIHGGYPRGVAYLWKKLALDLLGVNAWKTFAYFFGAPALNVESERRGCEPDRSGLDGASAQRVSPRARAARPLDDTSPALRLAARRDRWAVAAFHVGAPLLALAFGTQTLSMYLVLWLLPLLTVLQPILRLRAIAEHGAVSDLSSPLTAARSNRIGWLGRALLFPHHVNYHLEHHLYPAVPHYRLPALHRLLESKGALAGAEVRTLPDTLRRVFAPRAGRRLAVE